VEHQFLEVWQRYNRILAHRNAALRQGRAILTPWNLQLIEVAEKLDSQRREYATELAIAAQQCFNELIGVDNVEFRYQSGWNKEQSFSEALNNHIESDIKAGFTQRGPHRADMVMQVDGRLAAEYLSGGQQKLAACALFLAQARLYSTKLNKPCILLVDDLPSELDKKHRKTLLDILYSTQGQLFVTSTDLSVVNPSEYEDSRVFHVEHGCLVQ
jgi:DNA replication and repair protein RecF